MEQVTTRTLWSFRASIHGALFHNFQNHVDSIARFHSTLYMRRDLLDNYGDHKAFEYVSLSFGLVEGLGSYGQVP